QLGPRLLDGHARFQPADDLGVRIGVRPLPRLHRREKIGAGFESELRWIEPELRRHNSHRHHWLVVHRPGLAEYLPLSAETPLPQTVTQNRRAPAARRVFGVSERAAQRRIDA